MNRPFMSVTCNLTIESIVILDQRFFFGLDRWYREDFGHKTFWNFWNSSCEWFVDILMIGSTTENLADILKVQYLKVRKNNKNYNFVLIQMKWNSEIFITLYWAGRNKQIFKIEENVIIYVQKFLFLKKLSLKYYIQKIFYAHCSCTITNDSTICQTSR